MKWEADIHKSEQDTSSLLPSMVKTAILMNKLDGPLQQHLQLNASHTTDFRDVREMVLNFSKAKTTFKKTTTSTSTSSTTPMEVDALNFKGGKGKGKHGFEGKGKGKGRGKGPSAPETISRADADPSWRTSSQGSSSPPWCLSCGKTGHNWQDC